MNKRILAIVAAALSLASCSQDEVEMQREANQYDPAQVVCFDTQMETRGTPITSITQMTNMGVFCSYTGQANWSASAQPNKMFNIQLNRNPSGSWQYNGPVQTWNSQSAADRYTFFAYAPMATGLYDYLTNATGNGVQLESTATTSGIPKLRYTVPTSVVNQPDLMVANPQYNLSPLGQYVHLPMKHALTGIGFQVSGNGEKITDIRISGVKMIGRLSMDGTNPQWDFSGIEQPLVTNFSSSINYDAGQLYYTATPTMSTNLMKGNGYLMMMPQDLDKYAKIVISLNTGKVKEISLNTLKWLPGQRIDYKITIAGPGAITFTPSTAVIPAAGIAGRDNPITITCTDQTQRWVLSTNDALMHLSLNQDGSGASDVVAGQGSKTLYVAFDANTYNTTRTTNIFMNGDPVVTFTHLKPFDFSAYPSGGVLPTGVNTYAGAFWRANQIGERVIMIRMGSNSVNLGNWSASVAWMDKRWAPGDIMLVTTASPDPQFGFPTPGNAENYLITQGAILVSGHVAVNGTIYFRIGLKTRYTPTEQYPARYAVILLKYGTPEKEHVILLRQGEDPDYVMRPIENASGSTMTTRPLSARISPYNLTLTNMTLGGASVTDHPLFNFLTNPGKFTEYPTQTGAYFQWASLISPLLAYHPANTTGNIFEWTLTSYTNYWEQVVESSRLVDILDASPKNVTLTTGAVASFRRMRDGSTTQAVPTPDINDSEIRQSLWLKPPTSGNSDNTNSFRGYYADGFFDRRTTNSAAIGASGIIGSSVSISDKDIAHIGTIFYNPATAASLFFPAAGNRTANTGNLSLVGTYGRYWLATSPSGDAAWSIIFDRLITSSVLTAHRGQGYTIRCVRE